MASGVAGFLVGAVGAGPKEAGAAEAEEGALAIDVESPSSRNDSASSTLMPAVVVTPAKPALAAAAGVTFLESDVPGAEAD